MNVRVISRFICLGGLAHIGPASNIFIKGCYYRGGGALYLVEPGETEYWRKMECKRERESRKVGMSRVVVGRIKGRHTVELSRDEGVLGGGRE